ncbi:purine-nucleoside phosphorylase [Campylobacter canadensis]|uniref:purine-nucleoside phosphorylase n=1 Tax=Campylobacter canadensis TaxID=449520 RepID=UPI001554C649|nr:purine-nucleoside phosphorylase [Campylobacter canadensis]MBZ7994543.1 purine-nucleoside phosphorylase [Campylobacter canadensis]MBZ7997100.1 purine-nucleoside phosphorylase [Campylobacter canadensis]MBZ7999874.1 purine-nucleoside phosphorylase [Campylobacter canadensis]MBZ8001798.1 purine-nucleoside phosphorylase [Campylobacter canadensis]MBZ8004435.1 purine-nucleoside phosphorylase [Campylobacter canadensis]
MIICAGNTENYDFAKSVGVGNIQVAINLSKIILENKVKRLIFVGSMGLYTKENELFSIFEFDDANNIELSSLNNQSYTPLNSTISSKLNSNNFICKDFSLANKMYEKYSFIGENMEAFGFFSCAKYFNINAKAILIATNYCDENAHSTYLNNYKKANELLENYLENKGYL